MYYYIYAYESTYGGLHGLNSSCIVSSKEADNDDITSYLEEYGREMARDVVDDYGLESEYFNEDMDEYDEDEIEDCINENLCWEIYKVKDFFNTLSEEELQNLAYSMGNSSFIKKCCEINDIA